MGTYDGLASHPGRGENAPLMIVKRPKIHNGFEHKTNDRLRAVPHFSQGESIGRARDRTRKSPRRDAGVLFHSTIPETNEGLLVV